MIAPMPDLLNLSTPHFTLSVWTNEVDKARERLTRTHQSRGLACPVNTLRFAPAMLINAMEVESLHNATQAVTEWPLPSALFFENKQYEFEFIFHEMVSAEPQPVIIHRLRSIEEGFHYKHGVLRGNINFGNDIGWFRLSVCYAAGNHVITQSVSFEVLPTKMAMAADILHIHHAVDECYPLWQFSFAQITTHELASSHKPHERFELLWLAHFERLREQLVLGIKKICHTPHSRLMSYSRHVRWDRLRGKLSPQLEQRVGECLQSSEYAHRFRVNKPRLSFDTPENRFVKMVLIKSTQQLTRFRERIVRNEKAPDQNRVSGSFLAELEAWKKPLEQLLQRDFLNEVGIFEGMVAESLVLHQRAGYASVYRIWQELKHYLDVFGRHASISMKSIDELYEVWCLLEIRRMLLTLGFVEQQRKSAQLQTKGLEKQISGSGTAFSLWRETDGVRIQLSHEPSFSKVKNHELPHIYSWPNIQQPDILLEATFVNDESVHWVFDAKYRIDDGKNDVHFVPEDAINQMHRYRDALIYMRQREDGVFEKSRPILGAFALYPGWFDEEQTTNPYAVAIDAVGIGAFPLLPGRENLWLHTFLKTRFGKLDDVAYVIPEPDQYFAEDAARIPMKGTYLQRYQDLTLCAPLGPIAGRDASYLQRFQQGTAGWYHIRLSATDNKLIARNVMHEVRYCAVAVYHEGESDRLIAYIYEVESVYLKPRSDLIIEQSGKINKRNSDEYWLLKLGRARQLTQPIRVSGLRSFRFQLTNAADLWANMRWEDLPQRYAVLSR